ncbi:MAG TPA: DinB family protein [Aggregatilinea sp.]|uniref:DinB family protein n=1 Tax=Aggregatilinea sp. TaxID=2806333 RepID=UPI002C895680|nr:DinB family protein [Aggregatilinea sp.]HML22831.1 DinB family protein [Aggregatilinea sp.]
MPEDLFAVEKILTILAETPVRLTALTDGLPLAPLHTPPAPGEWSANDILAHLRACADKWGDYMAWILTQDHPTFQAVNPRTWIKKTDYPDQAFHVSFRAFAAQREDLLAMLRPLTPEQCARAATVTGAGRPVERTVHNYADRMARHERPHVGQIERTIEAVRALKS